MTNTLFDIVIKNKKPQLCGFLFLR